MDAPTVALRVGLVIACIGMTRCTRQNEVVDSGVPADIGAETRVDVGDEVATLDVSLDRVDARDVTQDWQPANPDVPLGTPAPWNAGRHTLIFEDVPTSYFGTPNPCGRATMVPTGAYEVDARSAFQHGEWIYFSTTSDTTRYSLTRRVTQSIRSGGGRLFSTIVLGANERGLWVFTYWHQPNGVRDFALSLFPTEESEGRVLWRREGETGRLFPVRNGMFTEALSAWRWLAVQEDAQIWVAGAEGEAPQLVQRGWWPDYHAGGRRVVFGDGANLFAWTQGGNALEDLTQGRESAIVPWVDGDRVAYESRVRVGPGSERRDSNIVVLDLRDHARTVVSLDSAERPANQTNPMLSGEWVVWVDLRHTTAPLTPNGTVVGQEVYGYNLRTRREYRLNPGFEGWFPTILGGRVWMICRPSPVVRAYPAFMPLPED